jgi:CheY-like chemotaxis protein
MNPRDAAKSTILVVEDEPLIRAHLIEAFEDAGFAVLEPADGDNAVRILEQNAPRVRALFSDINLPGSLDGVLLARLARRHWPWIAIVLASGRPKPDDLAMPENVRFFQKPYAINSVVGHVREVAN